MVQHGFMANIMNCSVCDNASAELPDGDWEKVVQPAMAKFEDEHLNAYHEGEEGVFFTLTEPLRRW